MANQNKNWSDILRVVWPSNMSYYCLFTASGKHTVVDRWLGAVSMAMVSTHLELHQLGCHKHFRATASYTAVVCLHDRFTVQWAAIWRAAVYTTAPCIYQDIMTDHLRKWTVNLDKCTEIDQWSAVILHSVHVYCILHVYGWFLLTESTYSMILIVTVMDAMKHASARQ